MTGITLSFVGLVGPEVFESVALKSCPVKLGVVGTTMSAVGLTALGPSYLAPLVVCSLELDVAGTTMLVGLAIMLVLKLNADEVAPGDG